MRLEPSSWAIETCIKRIAGRLALYLFLPSSRPGRFAAILKSVHGLVRSLREPPHGLPIPPEDWGLRTQTSQHGSFFRRIKEWGNLQVTKVTLT